MKICPIRNIGRDKEDQLEKFYGLEIKFGLHSTGTIKTAFQAVHAAIVEIVRELPNIEDEFIPKFEEDCERQTRLQRRVVAMTACGRFEPFATAFFEPTE